MTYNVRKDGCVRRRASHCRRVAWRFSRQKGTDDGSFKRIRDVLSVQKKEADIRNICSRMSVSFHSYAA